jgi:hypothetical protein
MVERSCSSIIPDLGNRWRWMFSYLGRTRYSWGKDTRFTLDRRLGGPHSGSGRCGGERNLDPAWNRTPVVQPVVHLCTEWEIPDFNYVHSGPSHLSSLEISWIKCDTAFAFILSWHVSIFFDHLQRVIFSLSLSLYTSTQSRDYCLYPKVVYIVLHVTLASINTLWLKIPSLNLQFL